MIQGSSCSAYQTTSRVQRRWAHHVFRRLDVDSFESALGRWAQECLGEGEATIAIDGKALRGIHGGELPGVRLVAAYAGESGLVLGQSGGQGGRQGE